MAQIDNYLDKIKRRFEAEGFKQSRKRMEEDYSLYRMNQFDAGEGFQSYTSNTPRVLADKIMAYLTTSSMVVRVPHDGKNEEDRIIGANKEKWVIGALNLADERLLRMGQPNIREQLSFHITLRGHFAGRSVLNTRPDGSTYVDITAWDPLHVIYEMDDEGISWIAHRKKRTRESIKAIYNMDVSAPEQEAEEQGIDVWDYYDREINCIIIDAGGPKFAKKPTKHNVKIQGMPCAPCFVGVVGPQPYVQGDLSSEYTSREYGESVYAANRNLFEDYNFAMSSMKTLMSRATRHPYVVTSPDGSATLETDPWRDGTEVDLPSNTSIELLPEITMPANTGDYIGLVASELQRGGLPNVAYGELQFQLSGYAANLLRSGAEHQVQPRIYALQSAYQQISEMLLAQFATGDYGSMEMRGKYNELKKWFMGPITAEDIAEGGPIQIAIKPQMPQDDPQKVTMAQMMREGPNPLAPDVWIWDNILDVQDVEDFKKEINAQAGETLDPKAVMINVVQALMAKGQKQEAMVYLDMLRKAMKKEQQEETAMDVQFQAMMQQFGVSGQGPEQAGQAPPPQGMPPEGMPPEGMPPQGPPGVDATAVSSAAQGFPPAPPTEEPTQNVAPEQPRPGARNEPRPEELGI